MTRAAKRFVSDKDIFLQMQRRVCDLDMRTHVLDVRFGDFAGRTSASEPKDRDVRLRCLELAARHTGALTPASRVLEIAGDLYAFVNGNKSCPA